MILEDIARCRGCGAWTTHAHGRCTPCERAARLQDTLDRLALAHLGVPAHRGTTRPHRPRNRPHKATVGDRTTPLG